MDEKKSFDEIVARVQAEAYMLNIPTSVWDELFNIDHGTWLEIRDMKLLADAEKITNDIARDVPREAWLGIYTANTPLTNMPAEGMAITHSLFRRALELPEWDRLRKMAGMDPVASVYATAYFVKDLIDKLPPEVKQAMQMAQLDADEQQRLENALQDLMQEAQEGDKPGEGDQEVDPERSQGTNEDEDGIPQDDLQMSGDESAEDEQDSDEARKQLEEMIQQVQEQFDQATKQAQESEHAALDALNNARARTDLALAQSLEGSADDLGDLKRAASAFGMDWSVGSTGPSIQESAAGMEELAVYLRNTPEVHMLIEQLGWAKRMITQEKRKSMRGHERFTHFETKELDIEDLAADEYIYLVSLPKDSPAYQEFVARAVDGDLLHSHYDGEERAGRGALVILTDESGSTRGRPRAIIRALKMAMMLDAIKQKRRSVSIPFSDDGQFEVYDPGIKPNPLEMMCHFDVTWNHGTEPYGPLKEAIELIKTDPSLNKGDILIVTDGSFGKPPQDFLDLLEEAREDPGLKVVAVVINATPGQADFADKVVMIDDLIREKGRLAEAIAPIL